MQENFVATKKFFLKKICKNSGISPQNMYNVGKIFIQILFIKSFAGVIALSDIVKIKGLKSGLQLSFAKGASFDDVQANLLNKLQTGNKFFIRGTTVFVSKECFPEEENEKLRRLFHRHGMLFSTELKLPTFSPQKKNPQTESKEKVEPAQKMLVVNKTIRGGQEVKSEGSIMIFGNVNPGAQVIAGGNIDIRGTCRGIVHAGAFGDESAFVVADRLMPMQIRIAEIIARSPDNMEKAEQPERASIKNGHIVFEPIMR